MNDAIGTGMLIPLHTAAAAGSASVGVKAATLGALVEAGFAVPEGVVLTTVGVTGVLAGAGLGPDAAPGEVQRVPLTDEVEKALAAVAAHFGDEVLAVRSSAVHEDEAGASFAGQYETVLHVRGLDGLRDAVRRCWASAHSDRVRSYRGTRPVTPLAVLIQRQVPADVAGVAFSANPVSGSTDEVLVSAVPGLADGLVAGRLSPDEWVVRGTTATLVRVTHQALAEPQVRAVAALARRAEAVLGGPQDIEWAMAGGRLMILQSRSITALPATPAVDLPPGTWFKDVEHYAEPFTAAGASLAGEMVSEGLSSMFEAFGGMLERMDVRIVGGEAYLHPVPLGGREGGPPPWWVLGLLARLAPPLRRRTSTARRMVRPEVFEDLMTTWETVWRPELTEDTTKLRAVALPSLDDRQLEAHLARVVDVCRRGLHLHFHLIPLYTVTLHDLVDCCRELLSWSEEEVLALVAGTSTASSDPTRALGELASRIADRPAARDAVTDAGADLSERLADVDPEVGDAFAEWCDRYAYRCINADPGSPLWIERPWMLARLLDGLINDRVQDEPTPGARARARRQESIDRARAALAGASPPVRSRFERALDEASRYYPL
ncbi:MAG: PEP/pyruvate-binding domain-containing protein, partial [Acidimicrobiales bacterium]